MSAKATKESGNNDRDGWGKETDDRADNSAIKPGCSKVRRTMRLLILHKTPSSHKFADGLERARDILDVYSEVTVGESASCVHTTLVFVILIAYWRVFNASSDPKKSPSEGVAKEDATKDTSDGVILPKKATSSVGIFSNALYRAESTAGGVATEERTNRTKAIAMLMSGMDSRNWRMT